MGLEKSLAPSTYEYFVIDKNGKRVDITGTDPSGSKIVRFSYYENILSPNITAAIVLMDVGGTVEYDTDYSKQNKLGSLQNALPLTGEEKIEFRITSKLGELNFKYNPLIVNDIYNPFDQQSTKSGIVLHLVSNSHIKNQNSCIKRSFPNVPISTNVREIIKSYLNVDDEKILVENTSNREGFHGDSKDPFKLICELAKRSIPGSGEPGYFFYETQYGINFRSIESLISQPAYPKTYFKNERLSLDDDNDFKIIDVTIRKNQNVSNAYRAGVNAYNEKTWDPKTHKFKEKTIKIDTEKINLLGKKAADFQSTGYMRSNLDLLNVGTYNKSAKGDINNDQGEWRAQSSMRYNLLFSQIIDILVPHNPNLTAGMKINCNFETVSLSSKIDMPVDPVQSGSYIIMALAHHFTTKKSTTHMTLIRDSYGTK